MAVSVRRKITVTYSGDLDGEQVYEAAENTDSPAVVQTVTFSAGQSLTFAVPNVINPGFSFTATAVTILKDPDYAGTLIMKGDSGAADAEGVYLHPTDPDTISLASTQSILVLKASAILTLRLLWT